MDHAKMGAHGLGVPGKPFDTLAINGHDRIVQSPPQETRYMRVYSILSDDSYDAGKELDCKGRGWAAGLVRTHDMVWRWPGEVLMFSRVYRHDC